MSFKFYSLEKATKQQDPVIQNPNRLIKDYQKPLKSFTKKPRKYFVFRFQPDIIKSKLHD